MKVTIHQPEHFPYLGFFQKMQTADLFVILDDVQFTKGNFQNRNKFKNLNGVDEWFTIELQQGSHKLNINEIEVSKNYKWKNLILAKLRTTFKTDFSFIYNYDRLIDINMASINYCRDYLNITTPMIYSSELNIKTTGSQRLADICNQLNATEYLSGAGGLKYLDESLFTCAVRYFKPNVPDYYTTLQHI